jgi:hypothetical protein
MQEVEAECLDFTFMRYNTAIKQKTRNFNLMNDKIDFFFSFQHCSNFQYLLTECLTEWMEQISM